jgi:hypothetical protein
MNYRGSSHILCSQCFLFRSQGNWAGTTEESAVVRPASIRAQLALGGRLRSHFQSHEMLIDLLPAAALLFRLPSLS